MKRILFFLLIFSISSILYSQETNEFGAFNFLGKMPIVSTQILEKIDFTSNNYSSGQTNSNASIIPYIVFDFLLHSQFNNESWNQSQVIKDFAEYQIDRNGNIKY